MKVRSLFIPFGMMIVASNFMFLSFLTAESTIKIYLLIFTAGILIGGPNLMCGPVA